MDLVETYREEAIEDQVYEEEHEIEIGMELEQTQESKIGKIKRNTKGLEDLHAFMDGSMITKFLFNLSNVPNMQATLNCNVE